MSALQAMDKLHGGIIGIKVSGNRSFSQLIWQAGYLDGGPSNDYWLLLNLNKQGDDDSIDIIDVHAVGIRVDAGRACCAVIRPASNQNILSR